MSYYYSPVPTRIISKRKPIKARVSYHNISVDNIDEFKEVIEKQILNKKIAINDLIIIYSYRSWSKPQSERLKIEDALQYMTDHGITFNHDLNRTQRRHYGSRAVKITGLPYVEKDQPKELSFEMKELNNAFDFKAKKIKATK